MCELLTKHANPPIVFNDGHFTQAVQVIFLKR